MLCVQCGKEIADDAKFCQWCGSQVDLLDLDAYTLRIKQLRRDDEVAMTRYLHIVFWKGLFQDKYTNFAEYGEKEFGLKSAQVYNYRQIGGNFVDDNFKLRIRGEGWSIGKLNELRGLSANQVNNLVDQGILRPKEMSTKEIRNIVKQYK